MRLRSFTKRWSGNGPSLVLLLLISSFPLFSEAQAKPVNPGLDEALRNRVLQFYGAVQLGRFSEAEDFLTEDSKPNFRDQKKNPLASIELANVEYDPAGSVTPAKAKVTVRLGIYQPPVPKPILFQSVDTWVLEKNTWLMIVAKLKIPTAQDLTKGGAPRAPAHPEELKFQSNRAPLGNITHGKKATARFSFKNVSDHPVSLNVATYCECLVVKNLHEEYKAGESGTLEIEFDTTDYFEDYAQTIVVTSKPGGVESRMIVTAYIPKTAAPAIPTPR